VLFRGYDQENLDAQYNIRPTVPEFQDLLDNWKRWSERVRNAFPSRIDIAYGDKSSETMDIFPADHAGAPIHVFIHGGYWQMADKSLFSFIAETLVPAGVTVAVLNHTLAPNAEMDEIVRECRSAIAWIWRNAKEVSGDAAKIYVSGHSSGGHLSAMIASTDWPVFEPGLPEKLVKGICTISGLFDLEPIRLCFLNDVLRLNKESADRNSPIYNLPNQSTPLIIAVGDLETDEYRRQSKEFAKRWQDKGFTVERVRMPGLHHYSVVDQLVRPNSPLQTAVLRQMHL
jgi:arylformamidase